MRTGCELYSRVSVVREEPLPGGSRPRADQVTTFEAWTRARCVRGRRRRRLRERGSQGRASRPAAEARRTRPRSLLQPCSSCSSSSSRSVSTPSPSRPRSVCADSRRKRGCAPRSIDLPSPGASTYASPGPAIVIPPEPAVPADTATGGARETAAERSLLLDGRASLFWVPVEGRNERRICDNDSQTAASRPLRATTRRATSSASKRRLGMAIQIQVTKIPNR